MQLCKQQNSLQLIYALSFHLTNHYTINIQLKEFNFYLTIEFPVMLYSPDKINNEYKVELGVNGVH